MNSNDRMNHSPNHPAVRNRPAQVVPVEQYADEQAQRIEALREFGRLIRAERLARGFQRSDVAVALGMHPVHHDYVVIHVEIGEHELTVDQARTLDRELGIPAVHLLAQAGVASLAQMAATGDDMPLAGRPVTEPTEDDPESEVFHCTAAAALSFAAAAFLILGTVTAAIGGGPWGTAGSIICGLGAWAALSVGFVALWCRACALAVPAEGR